MKFRSLDEISVYGIKYYLNTVYLKVRKLSRKVKKYTDLTYDIKPNCPRNNIPK